MTAITTATEATATDPMVTALLAELRAVREELAKARTEHREDIAAIGGVLIYKAEDHSWCGEYDAAVNDLNDRLHVALPLRERQYRVCLRGRMTIPYTTYVTVTVTSTDDIEDAAQEASYGIHDILYDIEDADFSDDAEVRDYEEV